MCNVSNWCAPHSARQVTVLNGNYCPPTQIDVALQRVRRTILVAQPTYMKGKGLQVELYALRHLPRHEGLHGSSSRQSSVTWYGVRPCRSKNQLPSMAVLNVSLKPPMDLKELGFNKTANGSWRWRGRGTTYPVVLPSAWRGWCSSCRVHGALARPVWPTSNNAHSYYTCRVRSGRAQVRRPKVTI
jgi:hypothetical protein